MDFDEYEYLEKTVENSELPPEDQPAAAAANGARSEEKDRRRSKHRDDETDRDSSHRSKRSRSEDESSRDRPRDHGRGSSRHRSTPDGRSRDSDRDRDRDRHRSGRDHREERNGKDRDREKEKERERERERREREREREVERSRRSRSRSERHRSEERDRHREKSKEMGDSRQYKEKKEEAVEPEADPERDQRTVFAYQISLKADERDVYEFFSRAGKVRDVRLIMDRNSRRSKGVGYIEFYDALSVPMAIALSGQPLLGQPVMVKPSEAEKNLVQSTATAGGAAGNIGPYSGGARRLYVGNLHFNITEEQLRQVFEPFGHVELVQLPRDPETGLCRGFGFVQFARLEEARAALTLNGQLDIAGKSLKVSAITDQVGAQDVATNAADLDDDEGGGLSLNARSRALLMQKLDRSGAATSVVGALVPPATNGPLLALPTASVLGVPPTVPPLLQATVPAFAGLPNPGLPILPTPMQPADTSLVTAGVPSECLLLKNMFDPTVETEPGFDLDIKEDVQEECSKFGAVKHIFVDQNSAGHVYLRFDNAASASSAQRALHGRWFAGKMITATYMLPQTYEAKFPDIS